uniref:Uncharacterized protein n=1 Tax=Arundo donax TaxID=35708 RepID=A0A0A9BHX8_ARUDO
MCLTCWIVCSIT